MNGIGREAEQRAENGRRSITEARKTNHRFLPFVDAVYVERRHLDFENQFFGERHNLGDHSARADNAAFRVYLHAVNYARNRRANGCATNDILQGCAAFLRIFEARLHFAEFVNNFVLELTV